MLIERSTLGMSDVKPALEAPAITYLRYSRIRSRRGAAPTVSHALCCAFTSYTYYRQHEAVAHF